MESRQEDSQKPVSRLLLCASGAFQTYATPGFVIALLQHVADEVQVVLSRAGSRMASRYAIEVASRQRVFVETDDHSDEVFVPHIELSRNVDLILVYPASVNLLGKIAHGIADELIAALVLAAEVPVIFVPVTNDAMWNHPAVRRNLDLLEQDGYVVTERLPGIEVATREGIEEKTAGFPIPPLLARIRSVASGKLSGRVNRSSAS